MDRYDDAAPALITQAVLLGLASVIAVSLRFYARARLKASLEADDWFAVVALAGYLVLLGLTVRTGYNGARSNLKTLPLPVLTRLLKTSYWINLFSPWTPAAARCSILFFYNRIFSIHKGFRTMVMVVGVINVMWWISLTVALILTCIPIDASWNLTPGARCINKVTFVVAAEVPDALLDFAIIGLPIHVLRTLQIPLRHKVNVAFIFILAGFVGLIGFIRIAITYRPSGINFYDSEVWVAIQLGFSVICCCLPTFRPLLPELSSLGYLRAAYASVRRLIHPSSISSATSQPRSDCDNVPTIGQWRGRYGNLGDGDSILLTEASRTSDTREPQFARSDFPAESIVVRKEIEIV